MSSISRTKYKRINKKFKNMTPDEKKIHIKFLWSRVRLAVLQRNTMKFIGKNVLITQKKNIFKMKTLRKSVDRQADAGFDPIEDEEEEERVDMIPWYMVDEDGKFMIFWQTIFSFLVLFNFIYAPFITAFQFLRVTYAGTVFTFEASIECLWGLSIIVNFLTASHERKIFTFKESSKRYLKSHAIPDTIAIGFNIYFIITDGKSGSLSAFVLFIRFTHFFSIFFPLKWVMKNYSTTNKKRQR